MSYTALTEQLFANDDSLAALLPRYIFTTYVLPFRLFGLLLIIVNCIDPRFLGDNYLILE